MFTVFTEMWGFYERLQLFLWFPGGLESTWTQYFFIRNDVIADQLEYGLPSWGSLTCGCLSWMGMSLFQISPASLYFGLAAVWLQILKIVCV